MRDSKGFDQWADEYESFVSRSYDEDSYPFAGYREVLERICRQIVQKPGASVLDLGFGTGALTSRLYESGCAIYGQDFSPRMIELASAKMPEAHLYCGDLTLGLVEPLLQRRYDFIVATYALHHLTDPQKIALLRVLLGRLNAGGRILIGDVAFETREQMDRCRQASGDAWDDEEHYFVADALRQAFPGLRFDRASHCAGILTLENDPEDVKCP